MLANDLRGQMEAYDFKNYILRRIFYRYLSEKAETRIAKLLEEDIISYEDAWQDEEYHEGLVEMLSNQIGFVIKSQYLFSHMIGEIPKGNKGKFDVELLHKRLKRPKNRRLELKVSKILSICLKIWISLRQNQERK